MKLSHLFGSLEAPGQKASPSKNIDFLNSNPAQPKPEVKQALVRPILSNGQPWNEYKKPLPKDPFDAYPKLDNKKPFPLSQASGAYGSVVKASNPETITGFGILPEYPDEGRIRDLLSKPNVPMKAVEPVEYKKLDEPPSLKMREKYSPEQIQRLVELGFDEELIGQAIEEEAKRDVMKVLKNPGLYGEAIVVNEIQNAYEKYKLRGTRTGTNASGEGGSSEVQSPSVRMAARASSVAEEGSSLPLAVRQRLALGAMASMGRAEAAQLASPATLVAARLEAARDEEDDSGMYGSMGGGAGGSATSEGLASAAAAREIDQDYGGAASASAAAAAFSSSPFAAMAVEAVRGKGGRPSKRPDELLETLRQQVATGKAQQTISETKSKLKKRGVSTSEIEAAVAAGRSIAMSGGGGGGLSLSLSLGR